MLLQLSFQQKLTLIVTNSISQLSKPKSKCKPMTFLRDHQHPWPTPTSELSVDRPSLF